MQKSRKLYALHLSFPELREIMEAERQHSERLRAQGADTTVADRVQKKAALLLEFTKQRFAVSRAKETAARFRKAYEDYTFSEGQEADENGIPFSEDE